MNVPILGTPKRKRVPVRSTSEGGFPSFEQTLAELEPPQRKPEPPAPAPVVDDHHMRELIEAVNLKLSEIAAVQQRLVTNNPDDVESLRCAVDTFDCLKDMAAVLAAAQHHAE